MKTWWYRGAAPALFVLALVLGGCDFLEWWQGHGGGGGGGGGSDAPDVVVDDPCAPYACDGLSLWTDETDPALDELCADRHYEMAPIVDCCGFRAGVEAAASDTCGDRFPAHAARVLHFAAGGDYRIDDPTVVETAGVVLRGEGGSVVGAAALDWDVRGTVFRCAVGSGESCLTFRRTPDEALRGSVVYERIQMLWDGELPAPADVVGLRIERRSGAVVRDASWDDFPGTALRVLGVSGASFERLTFTGREAGHSETALHLSCVTPEEAGQALVCSNGNRVGPLRVNDYGWGIRLEGGNATTIAQSTFTHSRHNAILIDGSEAIRIEGCRFQDSRATPSEDLAYVRLQRSAGAPWYPDVVLDANYFQCGCREARIPVAAYASATIYTPRGRVSLVDNTFNNCGAGLLSRAEHDGGPGVDLRTQWQCARNRVIQRTATNPSVWETWTLDACQTDAELPPLPERCL